MKILHLEAGRHLYGGAQQVAYLVNELAGPEIEHVLVCPRGSALARQPPVARVIPLPLGGDLDVGTLKRLRRVFEEVDPDLVHVHSRRGADFYGGLAAGSRWPAIVTRRVDNPEWGTWARFKYGHYRAVIAISGAVERQLRRVGVPPAKIHVVPSGVDTTRFRPDPDARARLLAAFGLPADVFVVGVVAQLIARKGHARLLGRIPVVVAKHPGFVMLGFGRGPLAKRLAHLIARRGVEKHVRLVGFRDDLATLLPGLDVVLHPVRAEGMGVAVLEAMAAGVPVVASAVGGIVDVIEDGRNGLLVAPDDAEGWVGAVERLMAAPDLRQRLGAAGRERIEAKFSAARMAAGNLEVYRQVLGQE